MSGLPALGIIGAGKVGQVLARLLYTAGYPVVAVHSRTAARAEALAQQVGAAVFTDPRRVLEAADLTLLTVPDDAILPLAEQLASSKAAGKGVAHTSGAHDVRVLAPLVARGAMVGSLHPAYPFADVQTALQELAGTTFAIEADQQTLVDWLGDMVRALNGTILRLPPGSKALYHAALVLVSNYTVTLYAAAEQLLLSLHDDRAAVDGALDRLLEATVHNLRDQGIPDALTGPLVRGDTGTITAHLDALRHTELEEVYRTLARLTFPLLEARHVPTETIRDLLDRIEDATDHT